MCSTCARGWEYSTHVFVCAHVLLFCIDVVTDTMRVAAWSEMAKLQDPELQRLARLLPSSVLSSRTDSTVSKYGHAFQR